MATSSRSSASGATPMAALDVVIDKLERQVVRTKERPRSVRERHSEVDGQLSQALRTIEPASTGPSVMRTKRFAMQPMFDEDAISQMEELGHAFVFLDAETGEVSVVYRRANGGYGVIQPVIDRGNGGSR